MVPKCPINSIGIRNPVMCSDGYMYEERCLIEWINSDCSSINRSFIDYVNICEITEKCLNEYCDDMEDSYERINFTYSKEETIIKYYRNMIEEDDEIDIIFDKDLILKLIDRNCAWFEFASEELKDDKEVVMKAIEDSGKLIEYASSRLQQDEAVVLAAVKTTPSIILSNKILVNHLIYETACYYNNVNFRNDFLLKNKLNPDSINIMIEEMDGLKSYLNNLFDNK